MTAVSGTSAVALRAVEKAANSAATALQAAATAAGKFAERGGVPSPGEANNSQSQWAGSRGAGGTW